jgi:hypothetical protein
MIQYKAKTWLAAFIHIQFTHDSCYLAFWANIGDGMAVPGLPNKRMKHVGERNHDTSNRSRGRGHKKRSGV